MKSWGPMLPMSHIIIPRTFCDILQLLRCLCCQVFEISSKGPNVTSFWSWGTKCAIFPNFIFKDQSCQFWDFEGFNELCELWLWPLAFPVSAFDSFPILVPVLSFSCDFSSFSYKFIHAHTKTQKHVYLAFKS